MEENQAFNQEEESAPQAEGAAAEQSAPINFAAKLRFNYPRTAFIGLAFLAISLFWQAYYYVIPLILTHYNLNDTTINVILMIENILAIFMLPLMGALSDKTRTRFGRRMPYIGIFTMLAAVCFALSSIGDSIDSFALTMTFLMLAVVFMSAFRSPAVALMPDLTPKPLRSKGNAVINIMGVIGGISGMGLASFLVKSKTITDELGEVVRDSNGEPLKEYLGTSPWFFIIVGIIMIIAVVALFIIVKEAKVKKQVDDECLKAGYDEAREEEKERERTKHIVMTRSKQISLMLILASIFLWFMGYTAITTAASRYAFFVWNTDKGSFALIVAQVVAFIGAIPAGILASKIGRKWTIMIGIVVLALGFGSLALFDSFNAGMYVFFGLIGLGWIVINVNSYPMVVELAKGPNVGRYTGYYYIASMTAQMVTKLLSGVLMDTIGYEILFPYGAIFAALAFVTMFFVRHGDSPDKKMSVTEATKK